MCRMHHANGQPVEINPHRLPRTVMPEHTKLRLVPDLVAGTYEGEVTIKVNVLAPTNEIALNAITFDDPQTRLEPNLVIGDSFIRNSKGTSFTSTVEVEPEHDRIHLKVGGTIGAGKWDVKVAFKGKLNDKLRGFYRSTYKDEDGKEQTIATTQFESTDARRAFPCFDEPDMKTVFELELEIDENLTAVSNGRIVSEEIVPGSREVIQDMSDVVRPAGYRSPEKEGTGRKLVKFAPTMKMSTYITAWVVGKLVPTQPVIVDGVPIRVWCVPGKEHLTKFALKSAAFSLRYFKRYFGVAYPSDKLDLLAIPDFAAGAMENLACATFREEALLVDESTASQSSFDYIAEVVAHEIAHMWFGDLVTMRWWNGLWLNEAFATFTSYKCVEAWRPSWRVWDKFGLSRADAFETDALKTTRSVEFKVVGPEDAEGMFDVLTYEKGCSVLRMLEMFMGEETFRKGISLYIQKHAYGNTEGSDLWNALAQTSGMDVAEIMHGWIFTPGFPVIAVTADNEGSVTLKQSQFKYLAEGVDPSQRWQVPVLLRAKTAEGVVEVKHMLTQAEETIYVGEGLEWVVANAGGHGFYRVTYSDAILEKLTANLMETLSVIERGNLIGDTWACVQAGLTGAPAFLKLVKLFPTEQDPNVWGFITGPLATLRRLLPEGKRSKFEQLVRDLVLPQLGRLGFEARDGESIQDGELRGDLIATIGLTGNNEEVRASAHSLFAAWKKDKTSVSGDVLQAVVKIVATHGDEAVYEECYKLFKDAANPEEEAFFQGALSRFLHKELHERTLALCLDPKEIRTQDTTSVLAAAIGHEQHGEAAWQFAKENWEELQKLVSPGALVRIANAVASLTTPELVRDAQEFFARNPIKGGAKATAQALEMQQINRLVRERETASLVAEYA